MPTLKPTTRGMSLLLLIASGLVFVAGTQLFVFTEQTDRFFAWTIAPPNNRFLTAATLGAAYWASCVLEFLASRERIWARARIAVPAVFVFTTLTLVVTLVHLPLFHLNPPLGAPAEPLTVFLTVVWLVIYGGVPIAMGLLWALQERVGGGDPARENRLPAWLRGLFAIQGGTMIALGVLFLIAPQTSGGIWPWQLTPLTTRAVGAWLVGIGIAAAQAAFENDYPRIRVASFSFVALGALELVAAARYLGDLNLGDPRTWLYLAYLVSFVVVGAPGLFQRPAASRSPA